MNNSTLQQDSPNPSSEDADHPASADMPQFGAVDIVEAFTAMRHEWRGQTKESRAVAELIQNAASQLESLESRLLASIADNRPDDSSEARKLVQIVVETDHQFSRAVTALIQWQANQRQREEVEARTVEQHIARMNWVARWFARPLVDHMTARHAVQRAIGEDPAIEGLNMVLARLRRTMHEQRIERLDMDGQPFNADTMHAIGTIESADCPAGHVVEQLSPAYRWRGDLIQFATVRLAK